MNTRLRPRSVIEFAVSQPRVSEAFRRHDISATTLMLSPQGEDFADLLEKAQGLLPPNHSLDSFLLVGIGFLDHLTDEQCSQLCYWMGKTRVSAVFALTPPGEQGVAGSGSRPLARLVALARSAGLLVREFGHFDLEPGRFAFAFNSSEHIGSSYSSLIVFIGPSELPLPKPNGEKDWQAPLDDATAELLEQRVLLGTHYIQAFAWAMHQITDQAETNNDLRRQLTEQVEANNDLRRQITERVETNTNLHAADHRAGAS